MTEVERKIAMQLGGLVALAVLSYVFYRFAQRDDAGQIAPIITAGIALTAAFVALYSIFAQRDIARRRASIDFFFKTEMDKRVVGNYNTFRSVSPDQFQAWAGEENFAQHEKYQDVRTFLNICELIAVGIHEKAFSERVSYAYWGDILPQCFNSARPLINRIRLTPNQGTCHTYSDLERLCRKWSVNPP